MKMKLNPNFWFVVVILALLAGWLVLGNRTQESPSAVTTGSVHPAASIKQLLAVPKGKSSAVKGDKKIVIKKEVSLPAENTAEMLDLKEVDQEHLMSILAESREITADNKEENDSSQVVQGAFDAMWAMVEEAEHFGDREVALGLLLALKDVTVGENLQSVLKKLSDYADIGGNEAIMDIFLTPDLLSEGERFRTLTYINPDVPLSSQHINKLQNSYDQADSRELRGTIAHTLAVAGGEDGVNWLINRADNAVDYADWSKYVDDLSLSRSDNAFQYFHESLNNFSSGGADYEMYRQKLRDAINSISQSKQ